VCETVQAKEVRKISRNFGYSLLWLDVKVFGILRAVHKMCGISVNGLNGFDLGMARVE
jgi:hypothetical protein